MNQRNENGAEANQKSVVVRKRRRRLMPPTTLAWPSSSVNGNSQPLPSLTNSSTVSSNDADRHQVTRQSLDEKAVAPLPQKISRRTHHCAMSFKNNKHGKNQQQQQIQQQQWIDKHMPATSAALCVAPKKIREVKEWIEARIHQNNYRDVGRQSSANHQAMCMAKLMILVGAPGIGKSTLVHVLANEIGLTVLEWNDTYGEYSRNQHAEGGIQYQSQIASFEEFLTSVTFPYEQVSRSDKGSGKNAKRSSIVLLDELPNLHTPEAEQQFRNVMTRYIEKSHTPTILIFSNVSEGKHKPEDLEKFFDVQMLYSPFVKILQINPVTKAKMKSCLKDIFQKEGVRLGTGKAIDEFYEELHLKNRGDLRHAIMNVQFQLGTLGGAGSQKRALTTSSLGDARDVKLSTFHALGKLLYAKRVKVVDINMQAKAKLEDRNDTDYHNCAWNKDLRAPLQFNPERVLDDGGIGVPGALSFVQYHAPDFFSDITELAQAFDRFSDAAFLLDSSIETLQGSSYPNGYATSLCSRAVGGANKHPAPSKFRQLTAPKMYEARRKQRENEGKIGRVCDRLSYREYHLFLDVNTRSPQQFATNELPYIKRIIPEEVAAISGNLYDNSNYIVLDGSDQNCISIELEQQKAVLTRDDIVDSSDSEIENDERITSKHVSQEKNGLPLPQKKYEHSSKRQPDVIIID